MDELKPMRMHEDNSEVKYFTRFLRPDSQPECNVVTLGMIIVSLFYIIYGGGNRTSEGLKSLRPSAADRA